MSYDFDEGDSGSTAQGPFLNWHAREKLDGSQGSRSFSLRTEDGASDQAATWSQAGAGAWAGLVSLMKAVKADGGKGETVVASMTDVEEIKFAKGGTSAPIFAVKKWADRPECLTEAAADAPAVEEDDSDEEF